MTARRKFSEDVLLNGDKERKQCGTRIKKDSSKEVNYWTMANKQTSKQIKVEECKFENA